MISNKSNKFNTFIYTNISLIKKGPIDSILNETYAIAQLEKYNIKVPKIYNYSPGIIEMEFIKGDTISSLYKNGLLTSELLESIFITLDKLHSIPIEENSNINNSTIKNWILKKFINRVVSIDNSIINVIKDWLNVYTVNTVCYTHGDPWFPNIIYGNNEIVFIDPRGSCCDINTILNDRNYDYAKILQSLLGYDSIIFGFKEPNNKNELIKVFIKHLDSKLILYNTIKYYACMLMIGSNIFVEDQIKSKVIDLVYNILNDKSYINS